MANRLVYLQAIDALLELLLRDALGVGRAALAQGDDDVLSDAMVELDNTRRQLADMQNRERALQANLDKVLEELRAKERAYTDAANVLRNEPQRRLPGSLAAHISQVLDERDRLIAARSAWLDSLREVLPADQAAAETDLDWAGDILEMVSKGRVLNKERLASHLADARRAGQLGMLVQCVRCGHHAAQHFQLAQGVWDSSECLTADTGGRVCACSSFLAPEGIPP